MPRLPRPSCTSVVLPEFLHRQLNGYALAATAAGVSVLALSQPATANIVFTKTHQVIGRNGVYPLDLNADGVVDFLIQQLDFGGYELLTKEVLGNAVQGFEFGPFASALWKGKLIGPSQAFVKSGLYGERMATVSYYSGNRYVRGPWAYANNRYLGLKFKIHGKYHYGWARLSVAIQGKDITATLTGYAYETSPKTRLRAGQKADGTFSLGALARGASAGREGKQ